MSDKKNILVIEDELDLRLLYKNILTDLGFNVSISEDGLTGSIDAWSDDYDLIVLDIMMPVMNGIEALRDIRTHSENPPVLIVSAYLDSKLGDEAKTFSNIHFIQKPFEMDYFKKTVLEILGMK